MSYYLYRYAGLSCNMLFICRCVWYIGRYGAYDARGSGWRLAVGGLVAAGICLIMRKTTKLDCPSLG
ncbi:hypothetical protein F5B19DRAFT_458125 [Rostrohypoxylon terebratum]|nr:hypothetical protein F5B19DRAFT_458125 [Rostrohypoxylon terebratum]